jgi:hypothetical protein
MQGTMNISVCLSINPHVLLSKLWNRKLLKAVLEPYIKTEVNLTLVYIDLTEEKVD